MKLLEDLASKLGLKDPKYLLAIAGGVAAVGVLVVASRRTSGSSKPRKEKLVLDSKESLLQTLQELTSQQAQMRSHLKKLTEEVSSKSMSLSQACKRCAEMEMCDPLEKYGLSNVEFNKVLGEYEDDPAVHEAVAVLMGPPPNGAAAITEAASSLTPTKLLDIHKFMLAEYERLASQSDKGSTNASIITFAAQAIVAGKAEAKYKVSVEDIESAVLVHQGALNSNPEFSEINIRMQKAIAKLMGIPPSA
mmetsp:Transcript_26874/g.32721  ORF Transcript_26874/g.32721 Transcript_26874/m.32721 type:complete len:249 (-) Transcript_26874:112-858(-)|eukprot:CAMPEP_0114651180 /NCGR_PEP_ID=MMETSP0191-20121206/8155_1 /TAXON_ID=126664 /ORGANISM="Sorites sp." /LENGTH=248 /DNA_ID=CAMNT_0001865275 /DNA_START=43 /DNA_END=789 /DNA_ORIENTATION=+